LDAKREKRSATFAEDKVVEEGIRFEEYSGCFGVECGRSSWSLQRAIV
jgi:hypothetical protein